MIEGLMWSDVVVLSEPLVDDDLSLLCRVNHSALSTSRRRVPLNRSLYPFSQGDPG